MLKLSLLINHANELIWPNYVLNKHDDFYQYGLFAIPSEIKPCKSYPARLVNQNEIPIDLFYK